MTRAAISASTPGARPQSSEPAVKASRPATNSRRRPIRSAHRPAGTRTAANTMVYAFSTQDSSLRLVPRYCWPMYGNARLTMNRSRLDMNTARASTPMIAATWRELRPVSGAAAAATAPDGAGVAWGREVTGNLLAGGRVRDGWVGPKSGLTIPCVFVYVQKSDLAGIVKA